MMKKYIDKNKADYILLQIDQSKIVKDLFNTSKTKIVCPFHSDNKPSMQLYRDKDQYHFYCFGCGKQYSLPDVYAKVKWGRMAQTPSELARVYNHIFKTLGLNYEVIIQEEHQKKITYIRAIKEFIAQTCTYELSQRAIQFLKDKGLYKPDIPYKYNIIELKKGVPRQQIFNQIVNKYKLDEEQFKKILIPVVSGRLIYGIPDENSNIIAFVSRTLNGGEPKYMNSGANGIYSKKEILYGMNIASAQPKTTSAKELIIVEGYNDALALWEHGFKNAVATGGTALTSEMVAKIKQWGYKKIILMLDNDEGGLKAMVNILANVIGPAKIPTVIRILPKGVDIDEVLAKEGIEGFAKKTFSISPVDFLVKLKQRNALVKYLEYMELEAAELAISQAKDLTRLERYQIMYQVLRHKYNKLNNLTKHVANALTKEEGLYAI